MAVIDHKSIKLKTSQRKNINETKSWFFKKINKINKAIIRLEKRIDKLEISGIKGHSITDPRAAIFNW